MVQTGLNAYKQNVGNTVISKEQLLMKLYTGSLNFLALAKRGIREGNTRIKGENITKVISIVTELDCALDMDIGGEMAENLSSLYRHILYSLVEANIKDDIEIINNAEHIIKEIQSGFQEVIKMKNANIYPPQENTFEQKGGIPLAI